MQKDSESFQKKNQIRKQRFPWKNQGSQNRSNSATRWSDWLKLWALWILVTIIGWVVGVYTGLILAEVALGPSQGGLEGIGISFFGFFTDSIISGVLVGLLTFPLKREHFMSINWINSLFAHIWRFFARKLAPRPPKMGPVKRAR